MADSNQNDDDYISSSSSGMDFSTLSLRTILSDQSIQSYLFKGSRSLGQHSFQNCDDDDDDDDNENGNVLVATEPMPFEPRMRRSSIREPSLDLLAVFTSAKLYGHSDQDIYESAQEIGFTDEKIYEWSRTLNSDQDESNLPPQEVFINLINDVLNESILTTDGNVSSMHMSGEIRSGTRASFVNHVALAKRKFLEKLEASRAYASKESIPEESMDETNVETIIEGDENRPPSPAGSAETISEPNYNDVLMGQSPTLRSHYGNIRLRELVEARYDKYTHKDTKKLEKTAISESIMQIITEEGGRFLMKAKTKKEVGKKRSLDDDVWVEAPFEKAREKVSTTFRNITATPSRRGEGQSCD